MLTLLRGHSGTLAQASRRYSSGEISLNYGVGRYVSLASSSADATSRCQLSQTTFQSESQAYR